MADEEDFAEGDVVVLKSGGPNMTVDMVCGDDTVRCIWFVGETVVRDGFGPAALKKQTDELA